MSTRQLAWIRIFGSLLVVTAYPLITGGRVELGVGVNLLAQACLLPWALRARLYDMAAISTFYAVVDIAILLK